MILASNYEGLRGYLNEEGKFAHFPGKKQKKQQALMLRCLAEKFEANKIYSETEVNDILNEQHSFNDPASLRRFLFGMGILNRKIDGSEYWLS